MGQRDGNNGSSPPVSQSQGCTHLPTGGDMSREGVPPQDGGQGWELREGQTQTLWGDMATMWELQE